MILRPEQIVLIKIRLIKIRDVHNLIARASIRSIAKPVSTCDQNPRVSSKRQNFKINFISTRSDMRGEICACRRNFIALRQGAFDLRARGELNLRGEILKF